MKKQSRKERIIVYKATHKLLCPTCEGKSVKELMIENMATIPFLVKSKCVICGYDGTLVEISLQLKQNSKTEWIIGERKFD